MHLNLPLRVAKVHSFGGVRKPNVHSSGDKWHINGMCVIPKV